MGKILRNVPYPSLLYITLGLNLFILLISVVSQRILPPQIPLFYGKAVGGEQIAPSWALVIPSLASLIIVLANVALSLVVTDTFFKKILIVTGTVAAVFASITTIKIILLVGSI